MLIFLFTGVYMRWNFPEIYGDNQAMRMMFRASHIYILLVGLLNLALGSYFVWSSESWKRALQAIGSILIFTATSTLVYAFFHEPFLPKIERFFTFWSVIMLLLGTIGHLIGSVKARE